MPDFVSSKLFINVRPKGALIGEASAKYLYSNQGLKELSQIRSGAKLIVLLRNPVDLVVSLHGQMLKEGRGQRAESEATVLSST